MKIKHLQLFVLLMLGTWAGPVAAQEPKTEGVVSYNYKMYWSRIRNRMTYLSQEEKDRYQLNFSKYDDDENNKPEKMKLYFNAQSSFYAADPNHEENNEGWWAGRKVEFVIRHNYAQETKTEIEQVLGKMYTIEDTLKPMNWVIKNQLKEINGYMCLKAETHDPVRDHKITAWFAQDLTVSAGPERYHGLPGLIMELVINDGDVVIEATSVEFKKLTTETTLPKIKSKKINNKDYEQMIKKHIAESIKAQQNPFWNIRY